MAEETRKATEIGAIGWRYWRWLYPNGWGLMDRDRGREHCCQGGRYMRRRSALLTCRILACCHNPPHEKACARKRRLELGGVAAHLLQLSKPR